MSKHKILFICNQGENRSRTAAELFKDSYETNFAGCYSLDKKKLLTEKLLDWSEIIMVMEDKHVEHLYENYPKYYLEKRIINLDIPDDYLYNDPELKKIIKKKVNHSMKELEEVLE